MKQIIVDGNTATAKIAYFLNEVAAIYPITPSSAMSELCDQWASEGKQNIFNAPMLVTEMQSEAGSVAAVHGSLSCGAISTTFTSSQGLLLMIPNMYKIAGEALPAVFHVSARAIATHALSIFGDHSDVMACRSTGFSMLCSTNVQECMDMALVSHITALNSSLPFLHFFDGFRTSHEIQNIYDISEEDIKKIYPFDAAKKFKERCLTPSSPIQKGTAQNPDVFFQNKEKSNSLYNNVFDQTVKSFALLNQITKRSYSAFEYYGHKEATEVVVVMGSAYHTIKATVDKLNELNHKVGVINVRLYRPFNSEAFVNTLPKSVKKIAVLDKTKESGAIGEPLFTDVCSSLKLHFVNCKVYGGRYGLGGKEFTPACAKAVYDNLFNKQPKKSFTVGITDDVTNLSLEIDNSFNLDDNCYELKFYGLGSDGTVSANKNSIKLIGENTSFNVQGYFEYDSKKSGSLTVSHLRISKNKIYKPYNVLNANFVAIHNYNFVAKYDILNELKHEGTVLLNTSLSEEELYKNLPKHFINCLIEKNAQLYTINAHEISEKCHLGNKINIIMQAAFLKLIKIIDYSGIKPQIIESIKNTYYKKGDKVVDNNIIALQMSEDKVKKIDVSNWNICSETKTLKTCVNNNFYNDVIKVTEALKGDTIPVSKFSHDGSIPTDTAKHLKRGMAENLPKWIKENCIQCGICTLACPHAAIRSVLTKQENISEAPKSFETQNAIGIKDCKFKIQISPYDCTGCGVCANVCPALKKALTMQPASSLLFDEKNNYEYSQTLKSANSPFSTKTTKGLQFSKPYFEFNYACAGCGETPYIKLATQLFGDRMIIANATGCSSIYSGSFPVCPFSKNNDGHGPAWANSLFEDNAEFGMGMNFAETFKREKLKHLVSKFLKNEESVIINDLLLEFLNNETLTYKQKETLVLRLKEIKTPIAQEILDLSDSFVKKSIWLIGGDGWAYDIGYSGIDHVLSSGENVNILVLDSEVYSNTGGQSSKSTPRGSFAKFAMSGKKTKKKDLGLIAVSNNNAYVASISLGADYNQTIKAFCEAEAFEGPSIIIAYSPCVNHGFDMAESQMHMKNAVECGYWNLYRYNPKNENPLIIDSEPPTKDFMEFLKTESRFSALLKKDPVLANKLFLDSCEDAKQRRILLEKFLK